MSEDTTIAQQLSQLEKHLTVENPVLLDAINSYRKLDKIGYKLGILNRSHSFATQITWWPLIAVLGTFSAGKSTFINHYLEHSLQRSGNQAVDDKFTVICYSEEENNHILPGIALDSDPRFPFYHISEDIEEVARGEGRRIDAYLQLKTCHRRKLRGKILIDSPGFDADAQRTSTLRITDHIIDLADLVLVFFDARHPEPGAMRDTLDHLVSNTIHRPDTGKFIFILNQLDTAAREDNPEDVVAAWQRALGERGLTAGRFYTIYNPNVANIIENPARRKHFETKRDIDLGEIYSRIEAVEVERAYRTVASLEHIAKDIEEKVIPALISLISQWRKYTLFGDIVVFSLLLATLMSTTSNNGLGINILVSNIGSIQWGLATVSLFFICLLIHFSMRMFALRLLNKHIRTLDKLIGKKFNLVAALKKSTKPLRSIFIRNPSGWNSFSRKRLRSIKQHTDLYVQQLNDKYTDPSGGSTNNSNDPFLFQHNKNKK